MSLEEMKLCLVGILDVIDKWCADNGTMYYLMYGTLLGAIRHKGFIPWDDDIDIAMPRADYEKFVRQFRSADDRYKVVDVYGTEGYYLQFAKVVDSTTILKERMKGALEIGVYIDIFPLDNLGNDKQVAQKLIEKIKPWRNLLSAKLLPSHKKRSGIRNVLAKIARFFPISRKHLIKRIDALSRTFENVKGSKYVGFICFQIYVGKEIMPREWFENVVRMEFEGHSFCIPERYDEVLTHFYGDYMQLPPVEDRVSHHDYEVFKIK